MDTKSKRKQIFVVAGNHMEYWDLLTRKQSEFMSGPETGEIFPQYIYVSHVDTLRGRSEIEGFYYGTYWSRPDLNDIKFAIDIIKAGQKIDGIY